MQLRERSARVKELEESLAASERLVAEQQQQIRGFETERRQLHNTIQELKVRSAASLLPTLMLHCMFAVLHHVYV